MEPKIKTIIITGDGTNTEIIIRQTVFDMKASNGKWYRINVHTGESNEITNEND